MTRLRKKLENLAIAIKTRNINDAHKYAKNTILILAAVAIGTLTGDNGLIARAQEARDKTEQSSNDELTKIAALEAVTHLEDYDYTDKDGKKIKIPKGFAVSSVEGEKSEAEGLVIIDTKGNEFVWIPCTVAEYEACKTRNTSWPSYEYTNRTWSDDEMYNKGLKSIKDLETVGYSTGFYVARYEAGIPKEMTEAYVNTDGGAYTQVDKKDNQNYTPVSKKGVQAWNYISQTNAKVVTQKMVPGRSYLINGTAWDVMIKKINTTTGKSITNSTDWGNYYNNKKTNYDKINTLYANHDNNNGWTVATTYRKGLVTGAPKGEGTARLELATGASDDFKAYNLYDVAGNMWEWTTEQSTDNHVVLRGGSFNNNGSDNPASHSYGYGGVGDTSIYVGFRVVLYM